MKPQSHYRAVTESKRGNSFCKIHYSTTTFGINKTTTTTVTKKPLLLFQRLANDCQDNSASELCFS